MGISGVPPQAAVLPHTPRSCLIGETPRRDHRPSCRPNQVALRGPCCLSILRPFPRARGPLNARPLYVRGWGEHGVSARWTLTMKSAGGGARNVGVTRAHESWRPSTSSRTYPETSSRIWGKVTWRMGTGILDRPCPHPSGEPANPLLWPPPRRINIPRAFPFPASPQTARATMPRDSSEKHMWECGTREAGL